VTRGWRFASKGEAARYEELLLLGAAGELRNLELQPRFPLRVNGVEVSTYVADFRYDERTYAPHAPGAKWLDPFVWADVVEDFKGLRTPMYRLKRKLVEALYGFTIRETGRTRPRGR
jgi:hypothetical protein